MVQLRSRQLLHALSVAPGADLSAALKAATGSRLQTLIIHSDANGMLFVGGGATDVSAWAHGQGVSAHTHTGLNKFGHMLAARME